MPQEIGSSMPQDFLRYQNPMDDGRRKIHPNDHELVRSFYKSCKSQRETAAKFGVSRRLIVFILHPERYKKRLAERRAEHTHLKYYDKAKWRVVMAKYRAKKRRLKLVAPRGTI